MWDRWRIWFMEVSSGVEFGMGWQEHVRSSVLATWLSAGGSCMYCRSIQCAAEVPLGLATGVVAITRQEPCEDVHAVARHMPRLVRHMPSLVGW